MNPQTIEQLVPDVSVIRHNDYPGARFRVLRIEAREDTAPILHCREFEKYDAYYSFYTDECVLVRIGR